MPPPIGPKVSEFELTSPYKRHLRDVGASEKKELHKLYKEMEAGDYSNSRDIKQIKGTKKNQPKVWQARINKNYRIRFKFKNGKATLLLVGPHKFFD